MPLVRDVAAAAARQLHRATGSAEKSRVVVVLACVLGLSSADASTVGASAGPLRDALGINNTDIGLLVAVSSLVGAVATLPFGVLADRVRRTTTLGLAIVLWGAAMLWGATTSSFGDLLLTRLFLGVVSAAAGPMVASLVGDYFEDSERGRIYGFILAGELVGAGFGFAVTGDVAALSWQAAFVILALPAFALAWVVLRLPEPARRGGGEELDRETDAQQLAREAEVEPDAAHELYSRHMSFRDAVVYVLSVRTNIVLIAAGALAYYFLAGVQTFGVDFTKRQYGVDQPVANLLLIVLGVGAVSGTLIGGNVGDWLLRRGHLTARILTASVAAALTTILFVPAILTRSALAAIPYLIAAACALSAQNPPIDAARLDIMPPLLWGRAESIRTLIRSFAQALAPLLFGAVSDYVFGGGRSGLQWTFCVMLVPLAASAVLTFRARRTYPGDVAAAAAATARVRSEHRGAAPVRG